MRTLNDGTEELRALLEVQGLKTAPESIDEAETGSVPLFARSASIPSKHHYRRKFGAPVGFRSCRRNEVDLQQEER